MVLTLIVVLVLAHLVSMVCSYLAWCVITSTPCVWNGKRVGIHKPIARYYMWFCMAQSVLGIVYLIIAWNVINA